MSFILILRVLFETLNLVPVLWQKYNLLLCFHLLSVWEHSLPPAGQTITQIELVLV